MLGSRASKGQQGLGLDLALDPLCSTGPSLPVSHTQPPFTMCLLLSFCIFIVKYTQREVCLFNHCAAYSSAALGGPRCHTAIAMWPSSSRTFSSPTLKRCPLKR